MLTKEEINALKAHKFEPYTPEEYTRYVVNPECCLRANIKHVHYDNQALSILVDGGRAYVDGCGPKSETSLILALTPEHGDARNVPLSKRRDNARIKALERMEELYASGMTWTEAEEMTHREMWHEFDSLGLACGPHNFHRLRYNR